MCMRMVLTCLIALGVAGSVSAQQGRSQKPATKPKEASGNRSTGNRPGTGKEDKLPGFTLEREAAALSFVRQHHPELADLLAQLKASNRKEYQRAVHELFRTSERLAQIRERGDTLKYDLDLEAWKLDSRIRLLAARMSMSEDNEVLHAELKQLLLDRTDLHLKQQLLDRERLAVRLEKLDAAIEKTRREREQQAEASLDKLLKGMEAYRPGRAGRAGRQPDPDARGANAKDAAAESAAANAAASNR